MIDKLTVSDIIGLEAYTNNMANELERMEGNAKLTDKMILGSKKRWFQAKNIILQKHLHTVLEHLSDADPLGFS